MSLRVLVEYCTKDRSEQGSFTLRGTETTYLDYFKQLQTLLGIHLPNVEIEENTEELFQHIRSVEHAKHADWPAYDPGPMQNTRMPRLGSFEVYLKMDFDIIEAPTPCRAERVKLVSSKIHSKRWPKVNNIVQLVLKAIEDQTQEFVLRSLDRCRSYYADEIFHSSLGAVSRPRGIPVCVRCRPQECKCPIGAFGETWMFAGFRELSFLPTEFMRVGAWLFVQRTVCNLHFVAAKIRMCGARALLEDFDLAFTLTGQSRSNATGNHSTTTQGSEGPQPSRQIAYEIKAYAQFLTRNLETLQKRPSRIYALASRMPLPGLDGMKKEYLDGFTELQNLSTKIDVEDRECTPEELLKFETGLAVISWGSRVGFIEVFANVEKRWLSELELNFRARLMIQQESCSNTLRNDGRKCRLLLEVVRNGTMRDVGEDVRLIFLSRLLSEIKKKRTLRLALHTTDHEDFTIQKGFTILDAMLKEFSSCRNMSKVMIRLDRDHQEIRTRDDSSASYFATVEFSALPINTVALEKVFNSFVDELEDQELASYLPNRCTLQRFGEGHDIDMLILLRLPNNFAMDDDEYKHAVLDDLRSSLPAAVSDDAISLEHISRKQLLARVHADALPEDTSPEFVAHDMMHQLQTPSSSLISDDRKVLSHTIWIGYAKGGSPLRMPGLSGRVCLRASGIPDLPEGPQVKAFNQRVLPALLTVCRTKGLILSLFCDTTRAPSGSAELRAKIIPDRAMAGPATGTTVVLANLASPQSEEQADADDCAVPMSAAERRKREDSRGTEVEAISGYNRVEDALSQLYPTAVSAVALPGHLQESQLQMRCMDRLLQENTLLKQETIVDAISEVCREATSTDISAPAVILLPGATAHIRAVALAGIVRRLVGKDGPGENSFVSYFFKPKGMALHHVLSYLTCDLWLQLLGGRHMRMRGENHDCAMADLCDVVHRAADSTVDPFEKSYLRVVLVLDNLSEEEQIQIAEGVLARPRLFPILSCVMSTQQGSSLRRGEAAQRMQMITKHMHTKILPLPPMPDPSSADGTEVGRRAAFARVLDDMDELLGSSPREQLMCQLITLPGLLEIELRLRLASDQTPVLSPRLDELYVKLQPFLELYPLLRNGSIMLSQDCCVDVMKRYLIPYMESFPVNSLQSIAQVVSSRQASPYIDQMHVPTAASTAKDHVEHTVEQVGQYWGSLEMASFITDRKRYKDWVVAQHKMQQLRPRPASAPSPTQKYGAFRDTMLSTQQRPPDDVQTEMLMLDKEIGDVMRMGQLAFSSPTRTPNIPEDQSFAAEVPAVNRPWSAEPRQASRMADVRTRPRTANSFRYRDDDIFENGSPEPARRLFQDDLDQSRQSGSISRRRLPTRPNSAGPWLPASEDHRQKGHVARRFLGPSHLLASVSEPTPISPDLEQVVQPYMKPWMYVTRPQEMDKDWVRKDNTAKERRRKEKHRNPEPNTFFYDPTDAESASELDQLVEMLMPRRLTHHDRQVGMWAPSDGDEKTGVESAGRRDPFHRKVDTPSDRRISFRQELYQAIVREDAASKRTNTVLAYLHNETVDRIARREQQFTRLTQSWKREETVEARADKRKQINARFVTLQKKKRKDKRDFREHVRESYVKWDAMAEAERKEFERLVRAAVSSRPAFDAYEQEIELEKQRAIKKKEREQRKLEPKEELPNPEAVEAEKQRRQRHEEMLVKRYGMSLSAEQVGAVTQLRGYGVRILREDQPATVMIGRRRMPIRKHRLLRGHSRRDESGEQERLGDTVAREHFIMQVIPTGKYDSGTEVFLGGYRLRVRYSNLTQKVRGTGPDKTISYEGFTRNKPIRIRVKGSDGYQAVWTEQPAEGTSSYTGIVETEEIVPAEFDVRDFVEIEGYFPAAREAEEMWKRVTDEVEMEFLRS